MVKGELTAFLSLVFLLLLSLVGALLESASIQVMKNERRADAGRAMESVFAEYQRELLEEYHIFAIDGSYETGEFSEENILNRLAYYGAENMDLEIEKIRYLTDQSGKAFFEQAVQYEKEKTGAAYLEGFLGELTVLETYEDDWETYEREDKETSIKLEQMLVESEQQMPEENNPLRVISDLKAMGVLELLLPEDFELSQKAIVLSDTVSERELREGLGEWEGKKEQVQDAIFFNLYLTEHFGNAGQVKEDSALSYELEYLLVGKSSDKENLENVLTRLCNLRFAANYAYLLTDTTKQTEARALAGTLCTLITVPGITEIAAQGILLAWAYGEAVVDVRTLIQGGKVGLWKNSATWRLSLESLLNTGGILSSQTGSEEENGFTYETYLRMLLFLKGKSGLSIRALDLMEQDLKNQFENGFFAADSCVVGMKIQGTCKLRRGIEYQFETKYEYQ